MTSRTMEIKKNGKWIVDDSAVSYNKDFVHECLLSDLIAKKLNNCTYIKSIKRVNNYNGTQTIIVTYKDGFDGPMRAVYNVRNSF